jgi:phosphoadenosine phosphosulfate reductase
MQLISKGQVVDDRFVRVMDEIPVPDGIAAIVKHDRLIADADDLLRRDAPTGVLWPNDRKVAELAPYLDRISLVALSFPSFRDGRAYSQARVLREQYCFRGELRATGQVLRDQFMFMLRAGFDSFEVQKDADAAAFAGVASRYSVFYQPTGDGRATALHARAARPPEVNHARPIATLPVADAVAALDAELAAASPAEIVARALQVYGRERLALVSSFGAESATLLKVVADVDPAIPVLFIDTGWLFDETLEYRTAIAAKLGLRDVRTLRPNPDAVAAVDPNRNLWSTKPEACCELRKVMPLRRALDQFDAWMSGRKRFHGGARAALPVVEADGRRVKFNPLALASPEDVAAIAAAANLPPHPLQKFGFTSVGCMPCSSPTRPGEGPRDSRWRNSGRTECGIHEPSFAEPARQG